jgi:hypothetical protein
MTTILLNKFLLPIQFKKVNIIQGKNQCKDIAHDRAPQTIFTVAPPDSSLHSNFLL